MDVRVVIFKHGITSSQICIDRFTIKYNEEYYEMNDEIRSLLDKIRDNKSVDSSLLLLFLEWIKRWLGLSLVATLAHPSAVSTLPNLDLT
jgi:hypothetical protein